MRHKLDLHASEARSLNIQIQVVLEEASPSLVQLISLRKKILKVIYSPGFYYIRYKITIHKSPS